MKKKKRIKKTIEKITGLKIAKSYPFGIDPLQDIKKVLTKLNINTIVDIGANIGQSAFKFSANFPEAEIYCIEPVKDTFNELMNKINHIKKIKAFNIAISDENKKVTFNVDKNNPTSPMNRITKTVDNPAKDYEIKSIQAEKLSDFCKKNNISNINYLKIDTEGYDMDVLIGAEDMLQDSLIDVIQVEVGMNPQNTYHNKFEDIKDYLEKFQYYLFGIYGKKQEWINNKHYLRVSDAVFISRKNH